MVVAFTNLRVTVLMETPSNLIESLLEDRQQVVLNGHSSDWKLVKTQF